MNKIIKNFKNIKYGPAPEDGTEVINWIKKISSSNKNYINGKWNTSKGSKKIKVINPSTNKKLFDLTISTKKDVDLAVNSARKAQKKWSSISSFQRSKYLYALARLIQKHSRFKNITNKVYVLDDSRDWAVNYEFLNSFYKNPKIVLLIRNPIDIFCSMEQQFRKNFLQHSNIQIMVELKNTSLEKRIDYWANTIPIGLSFERLHEVIRFGYYKNFLFIKYEDLCINKQIEINKFYEFINVEPNNVDFKNIKQVTEEDDSILLLDHKIRPELEFNISKAEEILGQKLIQYIQYKYAWFYEFFNYEIKFF